MLFHHIVILALIQGITEFLPISSSGHLVLAHEFMDGNAEELWKQNLMLDVAVHVGTLFSVLLYFRRDVWKMALGMFDLLKGNPKTDGAKLDIYVLISSVPVIVAGLAIHSFEPTWIRTIEVMGWTTIIFGALLWYADAKKPSQRTLSEMTLKDAIIIGLSQALALIPGTSRSGITMTAGRYLGFSRTESAHYSLLLAILAISGAGVLGGLDLAEADNMALTYDVFLAAFLAFISGWVAIALMMKWLQRATFKPFAIYRIAMGAILLFLVYAGFMGQV